MKRISTLFSLLLLLTYAGIAQEYFTKDILGDRFQQHTFHMQDDYEGEVVSTLVQLKKEQTSHKAILYIHGFNDYFFQKEMALRLDSASYHFFAVDLRKYGRSMREHQYPFNVRSLEEYFADIDSAITYIQSQQIDHITLMGHSTGGLIASLYAEKNKEKLAVNALILNSPFLDMNQSWIKENILIPTVAFVGRFFPNIKIPQGISTGYAESLLKQYHGEWDFNTDWKMRISPPLTAGWIRAIYTAQEEVRDGLEIPVPVLVMQSDSSFVADVWNEGFQESDTVLDVEDIKKYASHLGPYTKNVTIHDGMHDLILSGKVAREKTYQVIFEFLQTINP